MDMGYVIIGILICIGVIAAFIRHTQLIGRNVDEKDLPKPGDEKHSDFFGGSRYGSRGFWR